MKRSQIALLVIAVAISALSVGFWLGLREGAQFGLAFSSTPRGDTSIMYLRAVETGRVKLLTEALVQGGC